MYYVGVGLGCDHDTWRVKVAKKRLDIDALLDSDMSIDDHGSSGFVKSPINKQMLHPSRYFKEFFLDRFPSYEQAIDCLDVPENYFSDFLKEKASVTMSFAQKLATATNMPYEFWLRAQYQYDNSNLADEGNTSIDV